MPTQKKKKLPKSSPKKKALKQGRTAKWNDSMIQTAVNIIFDTGKMENVPKALGVATGTFYRWMETKGELREALARAREDHKKLKERAFRTEISAAIEGLNKLLPGYDHFDSRFGPAVLFLQLPASLPDSPAFKQSFLLSLQDSLLHFAVFYFSEGGPTERGQKYPCLLDVETNMAHLKNDMNDDLVETFSCFSQCSFYIRCWITG